VPQSALLSYVQQQCGEQTGWDIWVLPPFQESAGPVLSSRHVSTSYERSSPDGRFVMLKEARESTESTYVVVVENWFEELKRLAPTK
jgi:hypothetical protein